MPSYSNPKYLASPFKTSQIRKPFLLPIMPYSLLNPKLLCILCVFSLIACTPSLTASQASHTLALNSKGESFDLEIQEQEEYSFEVHQKLLLDSLNFYLSKADSTPKEVVVYIHGGMLGIRGSVDRSKVFSQAMKQDGKFPVIVNWESSFESSYFVDRLFNVRDGQYWEYNHKTFLHPLLAAVYLPGDILQGLVRSPFQWNEQFLHTKESFYDSTDIDLSTQNIQDLNLIYPGPRPNSLGRTTGSLFSQYVFPGVIKPVSMVFLDGIGREAWNNMLFKTQALIYGKGIDPSERGPLIKTMDLINQALLKYPNAQITLIGHSMGSIVISNLIRELPNLRVKNIVHMAAADNIRSLNDVVIPYLQKHPNTQFFNLTLDPYNEGNENNGADFILRGSLLNWIDNMYISNNGLLDRTSGSAINYIRNKSHFLPLLDINQEPVHKRMNLRIFGRAEQILVDGKNMESPQWHIDFMDPEYQFWNASFWQNPVLENEKNKGKMSIGD